jgi:hypothetical protein
MTQQLTHFWLRKLVPLSLPNKFMLLNSLACFPLLEPERLMGLLRRLSHVRRVRGTKIGTESIKFRVWSSYLPPCL